MPLGILLILTGVVSAAVYEYRPNWIPQFWTSRSEVDTGLVTDKVKRGPFLISLFVQGQLDSQKNATLNNQVEGTTTIIDIVPEGTKVKKGDVVCQLDASALEDKARQQEIAYTTAVSAQIKAREDLKIQINQNASDIAAAELAVLLAGLDREKFEKGEYQQQSSALAGKAKIAQEASVQARESYEFTKRQVEKGTQQQNTLEAARIKMQQAEFDLDSAKQEQKVLEEYTKKRTMAELTALELETQNELKRVQIKAEAARLQFEKDLEAKQLTMDVEKDKLDRYKKQIEACTLRAPQDGEVVYANLPGQGRGRSSQQGPAIEIGASVFERQPIINLPDVTKMKVACKIHESLIGAIRTGLAARVRVDAYASDPYRGVIAAVSSVPMTGSFPNMDLREYDTQVNLLDEPERIRKLRPGLTASVEILIDNREDVLQVPVQGVMAVADKHVSYVIGPSGRAEQRFVEIGPTNQSHLEVLKGLEVGDRVVLNPRSHFGEELAALEAKLIAEKPKQLVGLVKEAAQAAPGLVGAGADANGPAGNGQPAGPGRDPKAAFERFDADKDGSLVASELPERMQQGFAGMDSDSDGKVSLAEFTAASAKFRGRGGPGGGPGPAGGPPGAGPAAGGAPPGGANPAPAGGGSTAP